MIKQTLFPQSWIDEYEPKFIESPCITHLYGFRSFATVQFGRSDGVPQNQKSKEENV